MSNTGPDHTTQSPSNPNLNEPLPHTETPAARSTLPSLAPLTATPVVQISRLNLGGTSRNPQIGADNPYGATLFQNPLETMVNQQADTILAMRQEMAQLRATMTAQCIELANSRQQQQRLSAQLNNVIPPVQDKIGGDNGRSLSPPSITSRRRRGRSLRRHRQINSSDSYESINSGRQPRNVRRRADSPMARQPAQRQEKATLQEQLKELQKEMVELRKSRPGNTDWIHDASSPLSVAIQNEPMNSRLKIPKNLYDGLTDPTDHLSIFNGKLGLYQATEELKCKIFPTTLQGAARTWFYKLPPGSVSSWADLTSKFVSTFMSRRKQLRPPGTLLLIQQKSNESLRAYLTRFDNATLEIANLEIGWATEAFIRGTTNDHVKYALTDVPPTHMHELLERVGRYAHTEEMESLGTLGTRSVFYNERSDKSKDANRDKTQEKSNQFVKYERTFQPIQSISDLSKRYDDRSRPDIDKIRQEDRPKECSSSWKSNKANYTPLNTPISEILSYIASDLSDKFSYPPPIRSNPNHRNNKKRCAFHNDTGHTTEECFSLKDTIEDLIQAGHLKGFIERDTFRN